MKLQTLPISGPLILEPRIHADERGVFCETHNKETFKTVCGIDPNFVQDNYSLSHKKGTVRALHAQKPPFAQGKLVQCMRGSIKDVAVDIRTNSPTYGQHIQAILSAENGKQLWIPEGFLHGFETLEDDTLVLYKQTNVYTPDAEINIFWQDPDLAIQWAISVNDAVVSEKDAAAELFQNFSSPFT